MNSHDLTDIQNTIETLKAQLLAAQMDNARFRDSLEQISRGDFAGAIVFSLAGQWQDMYSSLQDIAKDSLEARPISPETVKQLLAVVRAAIALDEANDNIYADSSEHEFNEVNKAEINLHDAIKALTPEARALVGLEG